VHTIILYISLLFLLFIPASIKQNSTSLHLPIVVPEENWQPLRQRVDEELQRNLEAQLNKNEKWASLIKKNKMAVGLVDLRHPEAARFARVNGDTMMYAASLPKIAILLSACQAFEDSTLKATPRIMNDLNNMIKHSDNASASRMFDCVGFKKIEAVLTDPKFKLFDPSKGGGLWVGKRYARYGRRTRDPMKGLVHAASATQVCRFYYLLATGRLIKPERCNQMLDILSEPVMHHKFVKSLDRLAQNVTIYRKSGTWKTWHSDSVLVWGQDWRRYILVGLVEDSKGEQILQDLVPVAEELLKQQFSY